MTKRFASKTGTEVATIKESAVPATVSDNPYLDAADDIGSAGLPFLKFNGKSGKYSYGSDNTDLDSGHQLAVNMKEFLIGWICWDDDEVMEEVMVNVGEGGRLPSKGSLKDHGPHDDPQDGWKEQASVLFRSIEDGEQYTYKTSSASGVNVMRGLMKSYGKSLAEHPEEVMVVEIGCESFTVKVKDPKTGKVKKQENFKPVFDIVGWLPVEELEEIVNSKEDDNPENYEDEKEELIDDTAEGSGAAMDEDDKKSDKTISGRGRADKRFN